MRLFTIGYSKRSLDEFIGILRENEVSVLADVRLKTGSRFKPDFSKTQLADALAASGVAYAHLEALGNEGRFSGAGRIVLRDPEAGYAELASLLEQRSPVAIMCLERNPSDCHRLVVADEMTRRIAGLTVTHL
ncbi:MAG: DUF488 domain-containing protein [Chloroflexota bacterium]|nr:DUF488 domain-containing protein [Chloroflexota bacterium]